MSPSKHLAWHIQAAFLLLLALPAALRAQADALDVPYTRYVLANGLTLLVHEDHKAPVVAVNVWYHVGSKNEKVGKTGFAHLFEHLMFNGSEHYNHDYFQVLEPLGATDLNGTTNNDRTNYFETVPKNALDVTLWMESDRMGYMRPAIDQAKLDEQRGVVQNEKRQGENEPYGLVGELIAENTYPRGHPYSWDVIGSMDDLNAASLDDVKEWFRTYYGPNNAVLVIAGDITPAEAKARVEQYFGALPPGPPIQKQDVWIARMEGEHRQVMQDRVPQARIYKVWNVPELGNAALDYLDLVSDVLASGKTSRFYKRLVYDEQIATSVSAYYDGKEIGSQFVIMANARPGGDLAKVERALDEELAKFLAEGPTPAELQRVKMLTRAGFIRGLERVGGFGGKSDVLAQGEVYQGDPKAYQVRLQRVANATAANLQDAAVKWLSDGVYVLEVHPYPQLAAGPSTVDRSKLPTPGPAVTADFPAIQHATLSNGLEVVLAERHNVPLVNFQLLLDAGFAADRLATPGTASLAMNMLDEGTKRRTSLQISEELQNLGAGLGSGSDLDFSTVSLSALKSALDQSLDLYADVILNPSFPQADFERLKKEQIARIQQEKASPITMALRVFPVLLYGPNHSYGVPFSGTGTEAGVQGITRDALMKFHDTWFKPNNATLVVVGDITMPELQPRLEKLFQGWKQGPVPPKNLGTVPALAASVVYLLDKPGAEQSVIFAGNLFPPKANPDEIAIETMNQILGGAFASRINLNLREDKHWSYGAQSLTLDARGQRPFLAYAPVQSDKTKESMQEILSEFQGIRANRPATAEELTFAKDQMTLTLPGRWETMSAVAGGLNEIIKFGLPEDYYRTYGQRVRAMDLTAVNKAAQNVQPDHLLWVVVGDRSRIEAGIKELGLGEIRVIDADGNPVTAPRVSDQ